jgi:hypothetical protein
MVTMDSSIDSTFRQRKVSIQVDGALLVEMMVWAETPESAVEQVCRATRPMMREIMKRRNNKRRYSNGQKKKLEHGPAVE